MPVFAVLVGLFLAVFILQSANDAASALWPLVAYGLLGFAALALVVWHRRRMAELQQLHLTVVGRWANVSLHKTWPKYCLDCGQEVSSWRPAAAHDDAERSPCMVAKLARDAAEMAPGLPMGGYTAEVLDEPAPNSERAQNATEEATRARSRAIVDALRGHRGRA